MEERWIDLPACRGLRLFQMQLVSASETESLVKKFFCLYYNVAEM